MRRLLHRDIDTIRSELQQIIWDNVPQIHPNLFYYFLIITIVRIYETTCPENIREPGTTVTFSWLTEEIKNKCRV